MADLDLEKLSDEQLIKKLNKAEFAHHFEQGKEWQIFREGCDRLAAMAEHQMKYIDPIKDPTGLIETQVIAKFCRTVLKSIITGLKAEGRIAFDQLQERKVKLPGKK